MVNQPDISVTIKCFDCGSTEMKTDEELGMLCAKCGSWRVGSKAS